MIDAEGNEWKCQVKVDGYRAILHANWDGDSHKIIVFSRSGNDISDSLPELVEELKLPQGDFILDGEIIGSDGSYSTVSSRIGRKVDNVNREVDMEFKLFDAVIYSGEEIWDEAYQSRYERLKEFDKQTESIIKLLDLEKDYSKSKSKAFDNNEEGLILKRMDASYEFGKRSSSLVKHKFDAESVDCVVSGFEEGEGKATGTLGKIYLESVDGVSLGSCGTGFTDAMRDEIWNNQDEWLGRVVEIEGRGLGTNDNIRMPSFQRDRSDDGEADPFERVQELMKEV